METYDLSQTDVQVQDILNDAQKVMGAGDTSSMTNNEIMLKGTDGNYHKIDKEDLTEAVRNVLAGLLVNNDKGTTFGHVPVINSGDFGSASVANLASVLGGLPPFTGNGGEAISPNNLINKSGVHFIDAGQNGNPDSTSQWIIISHIIYSDSMGGSYGVQFAFAIDNAKVYYRMIWSSIREWKEL